MSGKKCYDLDGLRDVLRLAQRAIKDEKWSNIKKITFNGSHMRVIRVDGWHESRLDKIEDWKALNFIENNHPDGLDIDAHKAMNCII